MVHILSDPWFNKYIFLISDESPRLSTEHDTSTITIHSSNDPYGVFSIQVEGTGRVVEPSSIILVITRAGNNSMQPFIKSIHKCNKT